MKTRFEKRAKVSVGIAVLVLIVLVAMLYAFSMLGGDSAVIADVDRHFAELEKSTLSVPHHPQGTTERAEPRQAKEEKRLPDPNGVHPIKIKGKGTRGRVRKSSFQESSVGEKEQNGPALFAGVHEIAPHTFLIDAELADQARQNPSKFVRSARASLAKRDGEPQGFKISRIKKGSALYAIGLRNGDVLTQVNGFDLKDKDQALLAIGALKFAKQYRVDLLRKGKKQSLYFRIEEP